MTNNRISYARPKASNGTSVFGMIVAFIVGFLAIGLAAAAIGAFPLMIAFGVLHSYFVAVPAFGFWESLVFAWAARVIFNAGNTVKAEKS